MCGIAGYLGSADFDSSRLLRALAHRGPDANGTWSRRVGEGRSLHFVHTRLKILDLSEVAAQPMIFAPTARENHRTTRPLTTDHRSEISSSVVRRLSSADERLALVYNGEIYNFRELRAGLEAKGWSFSSTGDTEVLLKGYAEWGTDVFAKCDGMFAVAVYDGPRNQLVLARDHMGIKPLYWARTRDGGLLFASEVRAIVASGMCDLHVDQDAVMGFLTLGSFQEPATIYAGVQAFPAASFTELPFGGLSLTAFSFRPKSYWDIESFVPGDNDTRSLADWQAAHAELLAKTVTEQLVADVSVGVFLSGGLDSTVLLELLPRDERERVTAFTLGGALAANDEVKVAAQTCKNLGVRHVVVRPTADEISTWVSDGLAAMDQPSWDGLNTYLVSRASRAAGLVAVLNGAGADELHGAYGHAFKLSRFIRTLTAWGGVARPFARGAARLARAKDPVFGERLRLMIDAVPSAGRVLDERRRFFTPSQIAAMWPACEAKGRVSPSSVVRCPPSQLRDGDLRSQITIAELTGYLRNTLLRDSDWATMANHQEMRVPYLGRRYMELTLRIPWRVKKPSGGVKKPLIANLISSSNRSLLSLRKRGFVINHRELLLGSQHDTFHAACASLRNDLALSIDADAALAELARNDSGKRANRLWELHALGRYLHANSYAVAGTRSG